MVKHGVGSENRRKVINTNEYLLSRQGHKVAVAANKTSFFSTLVTANASHPNLGPKLTTSSLCVYRLAREGMAVSS